MTHFAHQTLRERAAEGAAVQAGVLAGLEGLGPEDCPYPEGSDLAVVWERNRVSGAAAARAGGPASDVPVPVFVGRSFIDHTHPED